MDAGTNDVRPIFCKNLLRQTHTFIEIFHKKFPIFSFMDKPSEKARIFSNFIVIFFTEGKKWNFVMKKSQ